MKRKVLAALAIATIAMVSCKKDPVESNELGTATINGNIWANLDERNDENAQGVYEYAYNPEGVNGMLVKVEVNTANWVQNPEPGYNYDKVVYTTTTDASGNFTLSIPATAEGYNISIEFEDVFGTKYSYAADGVTDITENVRVSMGNRNVTIYDGAVINLKEEASVSTVGNSGYQYGSATITGTVYINSDISADGGGWETFNPSTFPGQDIIMTYYDAPYGNGYENVFDFSIDANGNYTLTIVTESLGGSGVGIEWGMYDFLGNQTLDNAAVTADSTRTVRYYLGSGIYYHSYGGIQDGTLDANYDIYFNYQSL